MIPKLDFYKERHNLQAADEIRPGLEAMEEAVEALGHPQNGLRFIHVAGTNGKGSTVAFMEAIAASHGLRTASFTSPAITDIHDQIKICGGPATPEMLDDAFGRIKKAGLSGKLTDFELLTTAAFLVFLEARPDLVLLEAGMGGRLDSTNVITPAASVITSVALDHTGFLGNTLREIASHKAGILKPGIPGIIGPLPEEAMTEVERTASKTGAPLRIFGQDFTLAGNTFQNRRTFSDLKPGLPGPHQRINLALALEALLAAGIPLEEEAVRKGARQASVPGRFEQIRPGVFLDGAHNPAAAAALAGTIKEQFGPQAKVHFLIGMLARKDYGEVIRILEPLAETLTFVSFPHEEAASAERLQAAASIPSRRLTLADVQHGRWDHRGAPGVITGSLYLLSEIRPSLLNN